MKQPKLRRFGVLCVNRFWRLFLPKLLPPHKFPSHPRRHLLILQVVKPNYLYKTSTPLPLIRRFLSMLPLQSYSVTRITSTLAFLGRNAPAMFSMRHARGMESLLWFVYGGIQKYDNSWCTKMVLLQ